jgi:hypothetical protein
VAISAHPIEKANRPRALTTLETKLNIFRNVEVYLRCYKEVLSEMKNARIQPNVDSHFKKTDDLQPSTSALHVSSIKLLTY